MDERYFSSSSKVSSVFIISSPHANNNLSIKTFLHEKFLMPKYLSIDYIHNHMY